jgi:hypothetical protein
MSEHHQHGLRSLGALSSARTNDLRRMTAPPAEAGGAFDGTGETARARSESRGHGTRRGRSEQHRWGRAQ